MRLIIPLAIGLVLLVLLARTKSFWVLNVLMLWGAGLGFFMGGALTRVEDAIDHQGPGIVYYEDENGDHAEKIPESQYKREIYSNSGIILFVGTFIWVGVAWWAKETYIKRVIKKPTPNDSYHSRNE